MSLHESHGKRTAGIQDQIQVHHQSGRNSPENTRPIGTGQPLITAVIAGAKASDAIASPIRRRRSRLSMATPPLLDIVDDRRTGDQLVAETRDRGQKSTVQQPIDRGAGDAENARGISNGVGHPPKSGTGGSHSSRLQAI